MENREVLEKLVEEWNTYAMAYRFYLEISCKEQAEVNRNRVDVLRDLIYKWFGKKSVRVNSVCGKILDVSFQWYKMEVRNELEMEP